MSGLGCDSREPGAGCFTALAFTSAEIFSTLPFGSGHQMQGRDMAVMFLDAVQMRDQEIAPARRVFQEAAYFLGGFGIDAAPFGSAAHARAFRGLLFFLGPRSNSVVHQYILPPG